MRFIFVDEFGYKQITALGYKPVYLYWLFGFFGFLNGLVFLFRFVLIRRTSSLSFRNQSRAFGLFKKDIKKLNNDDYHGIISTVYVYFGNKWAVEANGISFDMIETKLGVNQIDTEAIIKELRSTLEEAELGRMGISNPEWTILVDGISNSIKNINEALK